MSRLREIAAPFVAAAPGGARVRTRLRVSPGDAAVLAAVGSHLGSLACGRGSGGSRPAWPSRLARSMACTPWGNQTIRWHPDERWLEVRLPAPLAHLANRPRGRYRLSCEVTFPYRGDEVAAQASTGAIRYDITVDPATGRWYLDGSWKAAPGPVPALADLRGHPVVAVDVNAGHLAVAVVALDGTVTGTPVTVPLELAGLPATTRDGRLRGAISGLIATARRHGARAIVIEDLDFAEARAEGRERSGSRPARGKRGRAFRRVVAGIPTGKLRDRLVQMTANAGLAVIVADPAYTC